MFIYLFFSIKGDGVPSGGVTIILVVAVMVILRCDTFSHAGQAVLCLDLFNTDVGV